MRLAPLLCLTVLACTPQSGADTDSTAAPAASTAGTDAPAPTTGAAPDTTDTPDLTASTLPTTDTPNTSDISGTTTELPGTTTEPPDTTTELPGTTTTSPDTTTGAPNGPACDPEVHQGKATYYAADGSGNCSFDAAPGDPLVAAMNTPDYAASAVCGACVAIDGPDGSITVRIVDRCPECPQGNIDLAEGAFPMIAKKELGIVPISWRYVSCPVDGDLVYHFKEGSNQWWTAVQVRNHRNAIAKFEYRAADDTWKSVARVDYNFFIDEAGMGPGPYDFRVTDVHGNVIEDQGVPFKEAGDSPGAGQFPACTP